MDYINRYIGTFKKYNVFNGRAGRKEFWTFFLLNYVISFALGLIEGGLGMAFYVIGSIFQLVALLPAIAVGVRRMHDTGRSGWWLICPIANFVITLQDSKPGENKYGPNPTGIKAKQAN